MSSISALSNSATSTTYQTPLQKLEAELQTEVNNGTVSSSDESALSSALQDIDLAVQASRSSDQTSGTKPSRSDIHSKIDDLIQNEVSSGKLTSDQATELKGVFQAAFAQGPGGPPPPPPSDGSTSFSSTGASSSSSSSTTTSSSDKSSTDSSSDVADLLQQFLQVLQSSLSSSSSSSYDAKGANNTSSDGTQQSALLIDYRT
jgi:hypothetical protein